MRSQNLAAGIVAAIAICGFAPMSYPQNVPTAPPGTNRPLDTTSGVLKQAIGEVASVDAKSGKLIVKTATDELKLDVQGASAKDSLSTLTVGDKVNVAYQDKGGMLVANSVIKATASDSKDGDSTAPNRSRKSIE
jgi:hypothetical protein